MEASDFTPADINAATTPAKAILTVDEQAGTVTLKLAGPHPWHSFDASREDIPVITKHGTPVPASEAEALIALAEEHGFTIEKAD